MLEHLEQGHRHIVGHALHDGCGAAQVERNGRVAEHGHPQEGKQHRHQQHAGNEFADGAATRDTRDKHADERRPRDPPAPVEQGPLAQPGIRLVGVHAEGALHHRAQVGADILHIGLQQEDGRARTQHEDQQRDRQDDVQFGQPFHALVEPCAGRQRGHAGNHGNQDHLHRGVDGQAEQVGKAGIDLQHAKTQRGGDPEHRAQHREDIDGVADRTVDAVADQRKQARAQGQRQAAPEREIGQRQADHDIDGPGMHAPVEEGQDHGLARRFDGAALAHRRFRIMLYRLGNAEKQQADAHPGAEQHGEPGQITVFGLAVVGAEPDVAITAEHQEQHEDQEQGDGQDIEPAEIVHDPGLQRIEHTAGLLRKHGAEQHEGQDQGGRDEKYGRIDLHPGARLAALAWRGLLVSHRFGLPSRRGGGSQVAACCLLPKRYYHCPARSHCTVGTAWHRPLNALCRRRNPWSPDRDRRPAARPGT